MQLSAIKAEIEESRACADRSLSELKDIQDQVRREKSELQEKLHVLNRKEVLVSGKEQELKQLDGEEMQL